MNRLVLLMLTVVCSFVWALPAAGQTMPLLQPGDPILAIDVDEGTLLTSEYPLGEEPFNAIDAIDSTKYLNFGKENSGFIVTPLFGTSQVQSMMFVSANDAAPRDPASWALYGTNEPIMSIDNSDGMAENWTLIAEGEVAMPDERFTPGPLLSFANSVPYESYRLVFPTLKDSGAANSMQIADVFMYESADGSGTTILSEVDPVLAIQLFPVPVPDSSSPAAEQVPNAVDGDVNTKYLNFGEENSGFIVTPALGPATVNSFQITTANDVPFRDPSSWELYGTNEPIMSENHSQGNGETWTLVDSGTLTLPEERLTAGDIVPLDNTAAYASYRMIFPTVKDPEGMGADSMQIAEIQFFADDIVPPVGVPGDYNDNGVVDAADYVVWRNGGPIENEVTGVTPGIVTAEDYDAWRARFGNTSGSGSSLGNAAVPEPAGLMIVAFAFVAFPLVASRRHKTDAQQLIANC